ncbi:uncharacterized protein LOC130977141 isoform X3 [Arachis stenosperma]|uniref:uncharacterized protein LOC130977141 isoform X3 n=1 Tax=Arachis stenosperma TaxID=217475 RepID=UPI0025AD65AB|nr:uncharacterized protein LOC130977141 isoform X3 [Arachis stenosperma]
METSTIISEVARRLGQAEGEIRTTRKRRRTLVGVFLTIAAEKSSATVVSSVTTTIVVPIPILKTFCRLHGMSVGMKFRQTNSKNFCWNYGFDSLAFCAQVSPLYGVLCFDNIECRACTSIHLLKREWCRKRI